MFVSIVSDYPTRFFEFSNDQWVSIKNIHAKPVRDLFSESSFIINRYNGGYSIIISDSLIIFTEPRCYMNHASTFVHLNEIASYNSESLCV